MLRKTISVIIMFFAMICVLSAENVKNSSFFLELNKPGESYISFIDLSSGNYGGETSSISFSADSAFSTAECSVGIIWNIYTENEGGKNRRRIRGRAGRRHGGQTASRPGTQVETSGIHESPGGMAGGDRA